MSKYDPNCPVFEVVKASPAPSLEIGSHFEGSLWWCGEECDCWGDGHTPFPIEAPNGDLFSIRQVRPITRAARQMLALVR